MRNDIFMFDVMRILLYLLQQNGSPFALPPSQEVMMSDHYDSFRIILGKIKEKVGYDNSLWDLVEELGEHFDDELRTRQFKSVSKKFPKGLIRFKVTKEMIDEEKQKNVAGQKPVVENFTKIHFPNEDDPQDKYKAYTDY